MNQLRFLLSATLILLSTSPLHGQAPPLGQNGSYGDAAVCNDGTIPFYVVRAARGAKDMFGGSDEWIVEGWFAIDPGKCTEIGPGVRYFGGGPLGEDSVALYAFAFSDSKGVFKGIKVQGAEPYTGWFYPIYPASQQICVSRERFEYRRNSPKQIDLARECDQARPGYMLIPASFMYKGSPREPTIDGPGDPRDYLHVKIDSDERAVASMQAMGSAQISQGSGAGGASQGSADASPSLCGKVSCWDLFAQSVRQYEAQREADKANNHPPAAPASNNPSSAPAPRARPAPPVDDDDPIGSGGGFITPANHRTPASDLANSLQWVRDDLIAYINASRTGFAAYKKGDVLLSQGNRNWESSVKPAQAENCWIVQEATSTTLSCLLSERADLNELRSYYMELTQDVIATLPRDWQTQPAPPFGGDLPNQGYRSSSGAHLEVWIARAPSGALYEIHFQLVSAH